MKKFLCLPAVAVIFLVSTSAFAQNTKSDICHKSGSTYALININNNAIAGHTSHGDALPGMGVPGMTGYEFTETCQVVQSPMPDFFPFYIRNTNGTIAPPWDSDLIVEENAGGNGFRGATPRSGQKVGYGTTFFDGRVLNTLNTVNWGRVSGAENLVTYLNIWVTDGSNYAIIASENDYRNADFSTRAEWKVFEYNPAVALDWLCASGPGARDSSQYLTCNGNRVTLSGLSNVTINSPSTYPTYVGTGAPRGGYGFNLIWGDTSVNFLGTYEMQSLVINFDGTLYYPYSQDGPTNSN